MIYAEYNKKTFECSMSGGGKIIKLLSDSYIEGFKKGITRYYLQVERQNCTRVYRKTLCFKYNNDNFLIREEKDNMVLLETGPRSYDLKKLGFTKILNDTFQKWVNINEGEKYWAITEY
ncbi:MAG: hypothetical protein E7213_06105 [Clostridium sp.]|nr:hypothetical protein [Clostridium sp.]